MGRRGSSFTCNSSHCASVGVCEHDEGEPQIIFCCIWCHVQMEHAETKHKTNEERDSSSTSNSCVSPRHGNMAQARTEALTTATFGIDRDSSSAF
mmetsp:Transcript_3055/g.4340  ORF Transcript_3055/g.4340 Transcript_3055/m.4340 type:complete len:95 (+) Transcript_3055:527-811(+)